MRFIACIIYFALTGIFFFFLGRLLPLRWFHWERFPYRTLPFEKGGALYKRLGVQSEMKKGANLVVRHDQQIDASNFGYFIFEKRANFLINQQFKKGAA